MRKLISWMAMVVLIFGMVGCAGTKTEPVETSAANFMTAFQNFDLETLGKYTGEEEGIQELQGMDTTAMTMLLKHMTYEVKETAEEEDSATATIEITNVNFAEILLLYAEKSMALAQGGTTPTEEELMQVLEETMDENTDLTFTKSVQIEFRKSDDGTYWVVSNVDGDILTALFGDDVMTMMGI